VEVGLNLLVGKVCQYSWKGGVGYVYDNEGIVDGSLTVRAPAIYDNGVDVDPIGIKALCY
jgi:hypothetical protein